MKLQVWFHQGFATRIRASSGCVLASFKFCPLSSTHTRGWANKLEQRLGHHLLHLGSWCETGLGKKNDAFCRSKYMYTDMVYIYRPKAGGKCISLGQFATRAHNTPWKLDEFLNSKSKVKPMAKRFPSRQRLTSKQCVCVRLAWILFEFWHLWQKSSNWKFQRLKNLTNWCSYFEM